MSAERITVVQAVNSLALAGAERTTTELACALDPEQFEVHVVVVRDGPLRARLESEGIPVHVVGGEFDWRFPLTIARTARVLRDLRPSIVHTHMIGSDITGFAAARLAGVPIVLTTQHDTYHRGWPFDWFRRFSGPRLAASVAISPSVVEYCTRALHVPAARVHVIENAVDTQRFEPAVCDQRRPVTFGAMGTLIPIKGHDTLLAAFARVLPTMPGARLLLAGQGPLRGALEQQARALGVAESVEFRGLVEDVPGFLHDIDILVHPSHQEAFGLAIVEGMVACKPIIASDLPAIRHVLHEGDAGMLVPAGDAAGFAHAMERLAGDVPLARKYAQRGSEHARAFYCRSRLAAEYGALYHQLLAARASTNR